MGNFKDSSGRVHTCTGCMRNYYFPAMIGIGGTSAGLEVIYVVAGRTFFIPVSLTLLAFHFSLNQLSVELILT